MGSSRIATYGRVATALALHSDRRLSALLDEAPVVHSGIGGTAVRLDIEGTPVFAKRVPLTDLERRPEHVMSTANLFELPTFCHYGLGSAGGGVWRELAAHAVTTNWVLEGRCGSFPLMYHWRVLPGPPPRGLTPAEQAELDRSVEFWHGSPAVRGRLEAIARASAGVVLFCEYVPQNLHEWLTAQVAAGGAGSAGVLVERELTAAVRFMNAHGLLHFDAHVENVLTDGRRLYLTDFGLASSWRFELSPVERDFLARHATHDRCHTVTGLVNWLVTALLRPPDRAERVALIRRYAAGEEPAGMPAATAAIVARHAPVAAVMNDFYGRLIHESRTTPYPAEVIERLGAAGAVGPVGPVVPR